MEGEGFEPSKAEPTDLQSVPFGRSGTPPNKKSRQQMLSALAGALGLEPRTRGFGDRCSTIGAIPLQKWLPKLDSNQ